MLHTTKRIRERLIGDGYHQQGDTLPSLYALAFEADDMGKYR